MLKHGVDHDRDEPAPHIRSAAIQRARWLAHAFDARAVNLFDVALLPGGAAGGLEAVSHG